MIQANNIKIHPTAKIHESVEIKCNIFELGEHSYIGPNCKIECNRFIAGKYLWMPGNVDVGRGGCTGPNSHVSIGDGVGIFEGCVINPSEQVIIGDNVGIGAECLLWTHGAWLDPTLGFPYQFESVSIGENVWFPAKSILLPGCSVGDNCVIGTGSIITKSIPSGSLAMGSPCKVVKENAYPNPISEEQAEEMLNSIMEKWRNELLPHKGVQHPVIYEIKGFDIYVEEWHHKLLMNRAHFDTKQKVFNGDFTEVSEDLRDFLRRHGIRIYNGQPFTSIKATYETTRNKSTS